MKLMVLIENQVSIKQLIVEGSTDESFIQILIDVRIRYPDHDIIQAIRID